MISRGSLGSDVLIRDLKEKSINMVDCSFDVGKLDKGKLISEISYLNTDYDKAKILGRIFQKGFEVTDGLVSRGRKWKRIIKGSKKKSAK